MNEDSPEYRELTDLLAALQDGRASDEQLKRLDEMLRADPQARRLYFQYVNIDDSLSELTCGAGLEPASFNGKPQTSESVVCAVASGLPLNECVPSATGQANRILICVVAGLSVLAASLLVVVVVQWQSRNKEETTRAPNSSAPMEDLAAGFGGVMEVGAEELGAKEFGAEQLLDEPTDRSVARIAQAVGVLWHDGAAAHAAGSPLVPGTLRFEAGLLQLEFYSGATVFVEGPAELELVSAMKARCTQGKLRAHVPPPASGFVVETPDTELVDLGTEFGMEVRNGEATDVVVFDGKVELYGVGPRRNTETRRVLTEGDSLRVKQSGGVAEVSKELTFASRESLARRLDTIAKEQRRRWQESADRLRSDADVLAFYSFETQPEGGSPTLLNTSGVYGGLWDGVIVGGQRLDGRWPWKRAIRFGHLSDRVRVNISGKLDSLTLAAWVRIERLPDRYAGLLMSDGYDEGEIHWQISVDGKITLGVQGRGQSRGVNFSTGPVLTPETIGRWLHVAVVFDRAAGKVTHYLAGKVVASEAIGDLPPLAIGTAELGNWFVAEHKTGRPIRNLSGSMDELLIAGRALSASEIRVLFAGENE